MKELTRIILRLPPPLTTDLHGEKSILRKIDDDIGVTEQHRVHLQTSSNEGTKQFH
jgi:hypothetical protein